MKSRFLKTGIGSAIFILLILTASVVIRPAYRRLTGMIKSYADRAQTELKEKTGLSISYISLSPSILSAIRMKGIVVYDAATGKRMCTLRKVVLSYDISKFMKGHFENALTDLTLSGLTLEYDAVQNKAVRDKILRLIEENRKQNVLTKTEYLPFSVHIKNAAIHFNDYGVDALASFSNLSISKNSMYHSFTAAMKGRLSVTAGKRTVSCSLAANGSLTETGDGSALRIYLTDITDKNYKLAGLNFIASYDDSMVRITTLRNAYPLYADVAADLQNGDITVMAKADGLFPFQTVKTLHPAGYLQKLSGARVAFTFNGSCNPKKKTLSYSSSGKIYVPAAAVPDGCTVSYSVSGDSSKIAVPSFLISGPDIDVSFSGTYSIPRNQPSGTLEIRKVVLPNGGVISADVYIDTLNKGFMCFAPQLFLDNQAFTALQLSVIPQSGSVDFSFEVYDYSHADAEKPGSIKLDGSYIIGTHYVQAGITASNLYLDSIADAFAFTQYKHQADSIRSTAVSLAPYIFSGELYVSSDFSTLSYNIPYSVIANTKKDRQLLVFAADGNKDSFQITRFELVYGQQTLKMTAMAELLPGSEEGFFNSDITFNNVPYKFNGTASRRWIDITGDYGFHAAVSFNPSPVSMLEPFFSGSLHMDSFPLGFKNYVFTVSADSDFTDTAADGFSCNISRFELQEPSGKLSFDPKLTFTGALNKYGFVINSLAYTDKASVLDGSGSFLWNINNGIFDSANAQLAVASPLTAESLKIDGTITNPGKMPLSAASLKTDMYFSGQADIKDFPSSCLLAGQTDEDRLSAALSITGTLDNPYVSLTVDKSSVSVLGSPMTFNGNIMLEDNVLNASDINVHWLLMDLSGLQAQYSMVSASGTASAEFDAKYFSETVSIPLKASIDSISEPKQGLIPESFAVKIASDNVSGTVFSKSFAEELSLIRTNGRFDIFSTGAFSMTGWLLDDGTVNLNTGEGCPVKASVSGYAKSSGIDLTVNNIDANLADFSHLLSYPFIAVYNGNVKGSFTITGYASDPAFTGQLTIDNPEINLPIIIPEHWIGSTMVLTMQNSEISMENTLFHVRGNPVMVSLNLDFDRWNFSQLLIGVKADPDVYIPADVNLGTIRIAGMGSPEMQINVTMDRTEVTGRVFAKDTAVNISTNALTAAASDALQNGGQLNMNSLFGDYGLTVSLDIIMGQKVQLFLDPMLRGVAVPNTELFLTFDSTENKLLLNSDIKFRGGEIVYLNRNFYMKEGRIVFSDKQDIMDPVITVRAVTRERDDDGNQVTISLSAENQPFSRFSPVLTATPAKSETEIMALLGQIVAGDTSNAGSLLLATGDYAMQVTVMRKIENALRDLCNFDIFSIRTMVLQNAMKQGLNLNSGNSNQQMTAGNFFDNSTVYIGKYFGSELYTDALLHWSYDKTRVNDTTTANGLVFQPEFGLEMASPFVNIRWSIAPDMDSIKNNLWIPTTSVTLSWKFTFK